MEQTCLSGVRSGRHARVPAFIRYCSSSPHYFGSRHRGREEQVKSRRGGRPETSKLRAKRLIGALRLIPCCTGQRAPLASAVHLQDSRALFPPHIIVRENTGCQTPCTCADRSPTRRDDLSWAARLPPTGERDTQYVKTGNRPLFPTDDPGGGSWFYLRRPPVSNRRHENKRAQQRQDLHLSTVSACIFVVVVVHSFVVHT